MKTPYEIKKGLECCSDSDGFDGDCINCPYKGEKWCGDKSKIDALAYIQQLENHIGEFTKNVDLFEEEHYRVLECLEKMQFFMGQRAGRELWMSKPKNVQDVDIEQYNHDIETVIHYIQRLENQIGELTEKVAQLEEAQPKWISVEERLPKQYVSVLAYMPDEYPRPTVHEGYLMPDGIWDAAHYLRNPDEVTYWANMPEPPKEEA